MPTHRSQSSFLSPLFTKHKLVTMAEAKFIEVQMREAWNEVVRLERDHFNNRSYMNWLIKDKQYNIDYLRYLQHQIDIVHSNIRYINMYREHAIYDQKEIEIQLAFAKAHYLSLDREFGDYKCDPLPEYDDECEDYYDYCMADEDSAYEYEDNVEPRQRRTKADRLTVEEASKASKSSKNHKLKPRSIKRDKTKTNEKKTFSRTVRASKKDAVVF